MITTLHDIFYSPENGYACSNQEFERCGGLEHHRMETIAKLARAMYSESRLSKMELAFVSKHYSKGYKLLYSVIERYVVFRSILNDANLVRYLEDFTMEYTFRNNFEGEFCVIDTRTGKKLQRLSSDTINHTYSLRITVIFTLNLYDNGNFYMMVYEDDAFYSILLFKNQGTAQDPNFVFSGIRYILPRITFDNEHHESEDLMSISIDNNHLLLDYDNGITIRLDPETLQSIKK